MSNGAINYSISADASAAQAALGKLNAAFAKISGAGKAAFAAVSLPGKSLVAGLGQIGLAVEGVKSLLAPLGYMKDGLVAASAAAADMERSAVAFEVMAGSAEKGAATLKQIKQLAAATPFEFPELAEAGQLLMNFGVQAEGVAGTLRKLGDVAAVRNNLGRSP